MSTNMCDVTKGVCVGGGGVGISKEASIQRFLWTKLVCYAYPNYSRLVGLLKIFWQDEEI